MSEPSLSPVPPSRWRMSPARWIGWAVVLLGIYVLVTQVRSVVRKKHGLPDIRHSIYWSKNLYQQASRNRSHAIAGDLASFYMIERLIKDTDLIVDPGLEIYRWNLERVSRTRVTVSPDVRPLSGPWQGLDLEAARVATLSKRKLYVFAEPDAKSYVFVSTIKETDPLYIVPERVYRSRAADNNGANLSAP
jgi:hypothetical protein